MTQAQFEELADGRTRLFPVTVEQYHRMLETGILQEGDPYELLEGLVVGKDRSARGADPMTVHPNHVLVVERLTDLRPRFTPLGCTLRIQQPITVPKFNEPEPDGAVVLGSPSDYADTHPGPADILAVIEVADASLRRDRTTKLRIYARAGIAQYVLINLVDHVIEQYTQPVAGEGRYEQVDTIGREGALRLRAGEGQHVEVPADELLP